MTSRRSHGPCVLAIWFLAAGLAAGQAQPVMLLLDDAIARALAASHRLEELGARRDGAAAQVESVRTSDRPLVAVHGSYTRTNHVEEFVIRQPIGQVEVLYPDVPDNYQTRLDLQWPVYTAGRTEASLTAARADVSAADRDLDTLRADLRLEVTRAYWSAVTAAEGASVVAASVRRLEGHLAATRARLDAGLVPPDEVSSVEAQLASERALLIETTGLHAQALVGLARLIALPYDTAITLSEPLRSGLTAAPDIAALVETAKRARQERRALEDRLTAARARIDATEAELRPTLAVVSGVDYARPNPKRFPRTDIWQESWDVSLNVNWTLFDWGRVRARAAQGDAGARTLEAQIAEFDSRLEADVRQRQLDLEAALARVPATDVAVAAATETSRVVTRRYDAGVATATDLLDAESALVRAEVERTRALSNVRIAAAQLERVTAR